MIAFFRELFKVLGRRDRQALLKQMLSSAAESHENDSTIIMNNIVSINIYLFIVFTH